MKETRIVKIKSWEKMKEEFGLDIDGDIDCTPSFMQIMERYINKRRIIEMHPGKYSSKYIWYINDESYTISEEMIEEEINPKDHPQYFI